MNIFTNFDDYGLPHPEIIRTDASLRCADYSSADMCFDIPNTHTHTHMHTVRCVPTGRCGTPSFVTRPMASEQGRSVKELARKTE